MPGILFAAKSLAILLAGWVSFISPVVYILIILFLLCWLYRYKKFTLAAAGICFFLIFLFFETQKSEMKQEKLKEVKGEVLESGYRKEKTILIIKSGNLKIWAFYKGKFEVENGNLILAKGSFFPVKEKNYFYSEDFSHTGRIYNLEILDKIVKKNPVIEFFHSYFAHADYPFMYYGFILGERSLMPEIVVDLFRENGCMHILAISGSHVAIIITFLLFLLRIFPLLPKQIIVVFLAILWGYLILLNFSPAPARAIVFTTVLGLAKIFERRMSLMDILYLSGFFILIAEPKMLYSLGFLLSFFATYGILYALPIIKKITEWIKNKPLEYFADGLLIGFFAQLLIFPILLYNFKVLNLMSLFLSIPLTILSTPILYWGLTGVLFYGFWEKLGILFLPASDLMTFFMLKLMAWTYAVKWIEIKTALPLWLALAFYAAIIPTLWYIKRRMGLKEIVLN